MMHWYWRALYTRERVRLAFRGIQVRANVPRLRSCGLEF
jgi:hypothetical protein